MARRRPGVYEHKGLVYPYPIHISLKKEGVKVEPGFSFKIPDDVLLQLSIAYLEACLSSEKDPEAIKSMEEWIAEYKEELRKIQGSKTLVKDLGKK